MPWSLFRSWRIAKRKEKDTKKNGHGGRAAGGGGSDGRASARSKETSTPWRGRSPAPSPLSVPSSRSRRNSYKSAAAVRERGVQQKQQQQQPASFPWAISRQNSGHDGAKAPPPPPPPLPSRRRSKSASKAASSSLARSFSFSQKLIKSATMAISPKGAQHATTNGAVNSSPSGQPPPPTPLAKIINFHLPSILPHATTTDAVSVEAQHPPAGEVAPSPRGSPPAATQMSTARSSLTKVIPSPLRTNTMSAPNSVSSALYRCSLCFETLPSASTTTTSPTAAATSPPPYTLPGATGRVFCEKCWRWIYDVAICWSCGEVVARAEERLAFGWLWWHWGCFCCLVCRVPLPPPAWNEDDDNGGHGGQGESHSGGAAELDNPPLCPPCKRAAEQPSAARRCMGSAGTGTGAGGSSGGSSGGGLGEARKVWRTHVSIFDPLNVAFDVQSSLRPLPSWMIKGRD